MKITHPYLHKVCLKVYSRLAMAISLLFIVLGAGTNTSAAPVHNYHSQVLDEGSSVYLPLVITPVSLPSAPRVNAPYFEAGFSFAKSAVFWFGQVAVWENYADVRVSFDSDELFVHLNVFDRQVWYDTSPSTETLTAWDGVTLLINKDGNLGSTPGLNAYRFDGQIRWWEDPESYRASYIGNGSGWQPQSIPFTADGGWVSESLPNDPEDDLGWAMAFRIPFSSLGLSSQPLPGTIWGMGILLHDRDYAGGTPIPDQTWPESVQASVPETWGQVYFGLPAYTPPPVPVGGTTIIRHLLNGAVVKDGMVGGGFDCGGSLNRWTQWGFWTYPNTTQVNVQNQANLGDWPCFSKLYIDFPLGNIPTGKTIISATLTLYHFGNSDPSKASSSLVQVLRVGSDWNESTLNWNNAPLPLENVSQAWVEPNPPPDPGEPRQWDLSRAVNQAYQSGIPLRLALYSADFPMHSGKYFLASEMDDYYAFTRPTLVVEWGP